MQSSTKNTSSYVLKELFLSCGIISSTADSRINHWKSGFPGRQPGLGQLTCLSQKIPRRIELFELCSNQMYQEREIGCYKMLYVKLEHKTRGAEHTSVDMYKWMSENQTNQSMYRYVNNFFSCASDAVKTTMTYCMQYRNRR